jgi:glycerol uptake facilitator-like aquaporin
MPSPASTGKLNNRIGWALFLNSSVKNHLVATLGELIGTTMFLFFAFAGTQVANINSPADQNLTTTGLATGWNVNKLLYVSFSFGFSLMVNVWIFFRISGALFNPAVSLLSLPLFCLFCWRGGGGNGGETGLTNEWIGHVGAVVDRCYFVR